MTTRTALYTVLLVLLASASLSACRRERTPEEEIRRAILEIRDAARDGDLDRFGDRISLDYDDEMNNDRAAVIGLFRVYVGPTGDDGFRTNIVSITPTSDITATAEVVGGLAEGPIPGYGAEVYRFELEWAMEDGDWVITRAEWDRAAPGDLLVD